MYFRSVVDAGIGWMPGRLGIAFQDEDNPMANAAAECDGIASLVDQGDVIRASAMLSSRQAATSCDAQLLVLWARVMTLRGRLQDARTALARALTLDAACIDALTVSAYLAMRGGHTEEALMWFGRAAAVAPPNAPWVLDWIDLLMREGRYVCAATLATRYSEAVPDDAEGWFRLGYATHLEGNYAVALKAYRRCARLAPNRPMLNSNLGAIHLQMGNLQVARFWSQKAIAEDFGNVFAWCNLANTHLKHGELEAAECAIERALALAPDRPEVLQTYVYVSKERQLWQRAVDVVERAHLLRPTDSSIVWSLAMLQLLFGRYEPGWVNHEQRWSADEMKGKWPDLVAPLWRGDCEGQLDGKTLLIWSEQGYGDVLQFVRFVPMLAERLRRRRTRVIFCTYPLLLPLLKRSLGDTVEAVLSSPSGAFPPCDSHVPLCSLPLHLGVTLCDVPGATHYLVAAPDKVRRWQARLSSSTKLKVGLVWSGSRAHQRNRMRAIAPEVIATALVNVDGVDWFSLQVGDRDECGVLRAAGLPVTDCAADFSTFDDTAACLANLDLVITVCTAVAHLAGGLGVKTWLLLDVNPHWVWMTEREDSPWYPSIRLYRQAVFGDWAPTLRGVAEDLTRLANVHRVGMGSG
ncbi:tetratricopeptide repeat protein [Burkholderia pseudomallei]|uniref:tetratricopeptide repeat protein n=1 Tax=Burkholderia pseudomallei TaxID=28450 RepID=UPI0040634F54